MKNSFVRQIPNKSRCLDSLHDLDPAPAFSTNRTWTWSWNTSRLTYKTNRALALFALVKPLIEGAAPVPFLSFWPLFLHLHYYRPSWTRTYRSFGPDQQIEAIIKYKRHICSKLKYLLLVEIMFVALIVTTI